MKIKNIRFTNNKIFKSGEIKLVDKNNVPYETIIFIGKCGAGKTTILDSIFKASTNANDNTTTFVTDVYQQ
jgi:predicted ATP-binding protein involved in virulence